MSNNYIVKTLTGEATFVLTEKYENEDAAISPDATPIETDFKILELKINNTKWKKSND